MTQSIIVYRNPAEAALWESGLVFPIICGVVISVIVALLTDKLLKSVLSSRAYRTEYPGYVIAGAAIASMIATVVLMS